MFRTLIAALFLLATASPATPLAAQADDQATMAELGGFRTPSANIYCQAFSVGSTRRTELRCDLLKNDAPRVRRPADCEQEFGSAFGLSDRGTATLLCVGDTVAEPSLQVLAYGRKFTVGGIRCDLTAARLRCANRDGHAFALSRRAQRIE